MKQTNLDHLYDPYDDPTDPRKAKRLEEIRRQASADADRAFKKIQPELRKLVRQMMKQGSNKSG